MHDLSISLGQIYKSESLAEVSRDNSLNETYDNQGFGINTTHLIERYCTLWKYYLTRQEYNLIDLNSLHVIFTWQV